MTTGEKWKAIIQSYKDKKGSELSGSEQFYIHKWFIQFAPPIDKVQKQINDEDINKWYDKLLEDKLPLLNNLVPIFKEIKNLDTLYKQSLIDFKNGLCSKDIVDYIENYTKS